MVKCPNCKKDVSKPVKMWNYGKFVAEVYLCNHCGTNFREYTKDGKHSFTLRLQKGRGWVKA